MKKIIASIIALIGVFSISSQTFANEPFFERLLDLNYGVEEYEIQLADLDEMYFFDKQLNSMHSEFQRANQDLKGEIMQYYRSGRLDYSQTQGMIRAHKNFVYHTNQIFAHMKYKELDPNYVDADDHIISNYRKSRNAYNQIKKIVNLR